jgi:undecaprenyl-diphosphatase
MWELIILAILQGLLEWLPVSSSGQVLIVSVNLLGINPAQAYSISIWLHLGTTLAVLIKFRRDYIDIIRSVINLRKDDTENVNKRNWVIFGTIGTAITAVPLYFLFRYLLVGGFNAAQGDILTLIISIFLIITGALLIFLKRRFGKKTIKTISTHEVLRDSFISGLFQGIAVLPGISRSAFTTGTNLIENYDQQNALKLSFLMSVPVAIASIGVDVIFDEGSVFGILSPIEIIFPVLISFLLGYATIELLLRISRRVEFGYFCVIYGLIAIIIIGPFLFGSV